MKRLLTCTDGTRDKPGEEENGKPVFSNVCLIYQAIGSASGLTSYYRKSIIFREFLRLNK